MVTSHYMNHNMEWQRLTACVIRACARKYFTNPVDRVSDTQALLLQNKLDIDKEAHKLKTKENTKDIQVHAYSVLIIRE